MKGIKTALNSFFSNQVVTKKVQVRLRCTKENQPAFHMEEMRQHGHLSIFFIIP